MNNSIVVYAQEEELGKYEWIKEELDIKPFDFLTMRENFILYDQDQSSVDSQLSDMCYYKYNFFSQQAVCYQCYSMSFFP